MSKFDELIYKAKTVASAAGKKTGEMVELSKLKLQVVQLTSDIDMIYRRIGELYYQMQKSTKDYSQQIQAAVAEVDSIQSQIATLNMRINDAMAVVKCDNCGASNHAEAIFCSRCGKTLTLHDVPFEEKEEPKKEEYVEVAIREVDKS